MWAVLASLLGSFFGGLFRKPELETAYARISELEILCANLESTIASQAQAIKTLQAVNTELKNRRPAARLTDVVERLRDEGT